MEDETTIFKAQKGSGDTQLFGCSGRFWIALVCTIALCAILSIATWNKTLIDAAGSVALLVSIISTYMGQNKPK